MDLIASLVSKYFSLSGPIAVLCEPQVRLSCPELKRHKAEMVIGESMVSPISGLARNCRTFMLCLSHLAEHRRRGCVGVSWSKCRRQTRSGEAICKKC